MPIGDEAEFSQAILEEAQEEADHTVDLARREAERILAGARDELEKIYIAESPQAKTQQAATRHNQIIASAELEARRKILLVQERYIQQVQEQVQERLRQLRSGEQYPRVLQSLIQQGLQELEGDTFDVLVAEEDRKFVTSTMLQELQQETGKIVHLSEHTQDGITGAIIQRADQRVVCDNSFQAIMRREQTPIRLLIAKTLFGERDYE
jgi:V/A-type H+-transporting ATPase subunit E